MGINIAQCLRRFFYQIKRCVFRKWKIYYELPAKFVRKELIKLCKEHSNENNAQRRQPSKNIVNRIFYGSLPRALLKLLRSNSEKLRCKRK